MLSAKRVQQAVAAVAVVAVLALLIFGLNSRRPNDTFESALAKGERAQAPDRSLPLLGAKGRRSLADYRGRYVVVNFWASWCDPCREESPDLQRFYERHRRQGVVVLGIDGLDVEADALRFRRRYHLTYPSVRDGDGERRAPWGVTGFPETFIVDRQGKVAWVNRGVVTDSQLERALAQIR